MAHMHIYVPSLVHISFKTYCKCLTFLAEPFVATDALQSNDGGFVYIDQAMFGPDCSLEAFHV